MPQQDLTQPLDDSASVYPGDPPVELEPHATHETDGYRVTDLHLGSHAGTHVDAPAHTEPDGATLDDLPVSRFCFDARLVDCTDVAAREPISPAQLPDDEEVDAGVDLLVVSTGWHAHWGTERYRDHPFLSEAAAQWCAERDLAVGLDVLSPDPTPAASPDDSPSASADCSSGSAAAAADPDEQSAGVPAHHALLGSDCLVLENLTNLDGLPERFEVRAYPLALAGGDGAPTRAVAVWE